MYHAQEDLNVSSVIASFCHVVNEVFALLGCYCSAVREGVLYSQITLVGVLLISGVSSDGPSGLTVGN